MNAQYHTLLYVILKIAQSLISYANKCLKVITQNIRSLNRTIPNFLTLIYESQVKSGIIILTECWLPSVFHVPLIEGYSSTSITCNFTQNEGVVYYFESININIKVMHIV